MFALILCNFSQPIQAFEHPTFKKMIEVAARATNGVQIPSRKQTRAQIIRTFKDQMKALKERFNVSSMFIIQFNSLTRSV